MFVDVQAAQDRMAIFLCLDALSRITYRLNWHTDPRFIIFRPQFYNFITLIHLLVRTYFSYLPSISHRHERYIPFPE